VHLRKNHLIELGANKVDTINRSICQHCGQLNFVEMGDLDDLTVPDVEGYKCWNCKTVSRVNDQDDRKIICHENGEDFSDEDGCDIFVEDGKKKL
jgi:hypothetical protein